MTHRVDDELLDSVAGWLLPLDAQLIRWFLFEQEQLGISGMLAEMGAYLGRRAVLIGDCLGADEDFTVVDLFGEPPDDAGNLVENDKYYDGLAQAAFETNYMRVHLGALPTVIRGYSHDIIKHARLGAHRFIHVDAGHNYPQVREDIAAPRKLAQPDCILVFDDISMAHTPGEAVTREGLNVIAVTPGKLYGTWSPADNWISRLTAWLPDSGIPWELQVIAGRPLVLIGTLTGPERVRRTARHGRAKKVALSTTPPVARDAARRLGVWRRR